MSERERERDQSIARPLSNNQIRREKEEKKNSNKGRLPNFNKTENHIKQDTTR